MGSTFLETSSSNCEGLPYIDDNAPLVPSIGFNKNSEEKILSELLL
jgi:hypothetical protein